MKWWYGALMLIISHTVFAVTLNTGAPTYSITEISMSTVIKRRITTMKQSGAWQRHVESMQHIVSVDAMTPNAVIGITTTIMPRTFYYDPTVIVPTEVTTPAGTVIVPTSTVYNPLSKIKLNETLVFLDARDPGQRAWARKEAGQLKGAVKWILIGGDWVTESKVLQTRMYFDQEGRIVHTLHIFHTPAIVTQDGLRLKISEVQP